MVRSRHSVCALAYASTATEGGHFDSRTQNYPSADDSECRSSCRYFDDEPHLNLQLLRPEVTARHLLYGPTNRNVAAKTLIGKARRLAPSTNL